MRNVNLRAFRGALIVVVLLVHSASAGGSYYGIDPGTKPDLKGEVSEWPVPTPQFARDPAPGPDGTIYIAVMHGNKIARFDPKTETFKEWDLPEKATPHGLLVDGEGRVWYTGYGNGTIGELDVKTGKVIQHEVPGGGNPHTLIIDDGVIWFSIRGTDRLGRLDTGSGEVKSYPAPGGPYGLTLDHEGNVWVCLMEGNRMGKFDPESERMTEVEMGPGTSPRRVATAPDGSLWITQYGNGKLVRMDPATGEVVKEYDLPAGPKGRPYAVTVDGAGQVWANEISVDTVVRLDPSDGEIQVVELPSQGVGIRKMIVDAEGSLWYMGSHNGRLGVVR